LILTDTTLAQMRARLSAGMPTGWEVILRRE